MAFVSYREYSVDDRFLAECPPRILEQNYGKLPNFLRIHAPNADTAKRHACLHDTVMEGLSELSALQRVMIGVVVSQINDSLYWLQHLGKEMRALGQDENVVARLQSDFRAADLPPADRAMLEYCAKLTLSPRAVNEADIDALRKSGFSDAAIHDVCLTAAYHAFANRLTSGLGVEFERRS
jgi:uncharacterized peroxidase-related enzyme